MPAPMLNDVTTGVCIFLIALTPLAGVGLALINTGLGRSRSAAHAMLSSLLVFAVAALAYFVVGFAWQGTAAGAAHAFTIAGKSWNWIAAEPFFLRGLHGSQGPLFAWLQMMSVGIAALIPLGVGLDRWRLGAICFSSALFAGFTYPFFAHWVWAGGWLAQLGGNYGLGRGFVDAGGSATIHATGGLTAFAIAWILGPRHGKYSLDGMPAAIPGHNIVLVLLGCALALPGWGGLNSVGALLFTGGELGRTPVVAMNTMLAASASAMAVVLITRLRFGKPDASLVANGWVGGLVASSAGVAWFSPVAAVLVGAITGVLIALAVELFELRLAMDDPGGALSVHAVAGLWGVLAAGLFAPFAGQLLAQVVGIATLLGFVLPLTYLLNWFLNLVYRQRVPHDGERLGLDLFELGAGAYPEFSTYGDEFWQR